MPDVLEAPDAPFRLTTPIEHITTLDDGTVLLHCVATSERPDSQGEIIDYDAAKAAAPDFLKWAALTEMHDGGTSPGTALRLHFDDQARRIEADLHVVDPVAVKKVLTRTYKAVSMGGIKLATTLVQVAGQTYRKVTSLRWDELALVTRPANADAVIIKQFVLAKRAQEPAMTDTLDAGMASPADPSAAEEVRSAEQIAIDETRASLAKAEAEAGSSPPTASKKEKKMAKKAARAAQAAEETIVKADAPPPPPAAPAAAEDEAPEGAAKPPFPGAKAPFKSKKAARKAAKMAKRDKLAAFAKGNKTIKDLAEAYEAVMCAIQEEADEGDQDGVKALQAIADSIHECMSAEAAEPDGGDDDDGDDAEAVFDPEVALAYAKAQRRAAGRAGRLAKRLSAATRSNGRLRKAAGKLRKERRELRKAAVLTSVLTKAGARNSKSDIAKIDAIHEATVDLGTTSHKAAAVADARADTPLAKADSSVTIRDALKDLVPAGKLDAIEARLAAIDEKSKAQGEQLAKIAKSPSGGGPATAYAPVFRGPAEVTDKASALEKAAEVVDDPRLKEQIGEAASLETIRRLRAG